MTFVISSDGENLHDEHDENVTTMVGCKRFTVLLHEQGASNPYVLALN